MFGGEENPFLHQAERQRGNFFWSIIQAIIVALAINVTVYFLFIMPSQVDGPSMFPTLADQELLFANKIPSWLGNTDFGKQNGIDFQQGDVIIFEYQNIYLVKRIIGVEGDQIKLLNGYVFVNGVMVTESYLNSTIRTYFPPVDIALYQEGEEFTVPVGKYFVLGDNRPASKDSRYKDVGFIDRSKLKGVVFLRFFPFDKFGVISRAEY